MVKFRPAACLLILICLALVEPCSAGKITARAKPGVDFTQYKTYQWLPPRLLANGNARQFVESSDSRFPEAW